MRIKIKPLYLVLGFVLGGIAQAQVSVIDSTPVPDMTERVLQDKYHIAPTKAGLLGALRHERSEVRSFAAMKLAADGQTDAIPSILAALTAETLEGVKITLATAAAQLGAEDGTNALKNMCEDQSWAPTLRMIAAQSMMNNLNGEACLTGVLGVLRSPGDNQAAVIGLSLLPRFKHVSAMDLQEVRDIGGRYLKNEAPELRIAASHVLREVGDSLAASQLRAALATESDDRVRRLMATDLSSIPGQ
jgi:HEAT repeat protein